jgi:aquaporin Z
MRVEYAMEGVLLGVFMMAACGMSMALEHPASVANAALADVTLRRALMGVVMGATAVALIRSPWGRQSGAHMNPALTVTYLRLGKIAPRDAAGYAAGQLLGGAAGVLVMAGLLGAPLAHPRVHFATTMPGPTGTLAAFVAEAAISFVLVVVVLVTSNSPRLAPWTPVCAGLLVATWITVEAPLSGMSMNPARSFASALGARDWRSLWLYWTAPPLGMLAAAEAYVRLRGLDRVYCAKLDHGTSRRCIFRCRWPELRAASRVA